MRFIISMVTNIRGEDSFLDVDFGDQSGMKTYSLGQIAAGSESRNYIPDRLYLMDSYAEGCQLVLEIHHQFPQEVRLSSLHFSWYF